MSMLSEEAKLLLESYLRTHQIRKFQAYENLELSDDPYIFTRIYTDDE